MTTEGRFTEAPLHRTRTMPFRRSPWRPSSFPSCHWERNWLGNSVSSRECSPPTRLDVVTCDAVPSPLRGFLVPKLYLGMFRNGIPGVPLALHSGLYSVAPPVLRTPCCP